MSQKKYKSKEAAKIAAKKSAPPVRRDSKAFKSGSNRHHGGSVGGGSGKPSRS